MNKLLVILFLVVAVWESYGCGPHMAQIDWEYDYSNIFRQTNLEDESFYPFLRAPDMPFYPYDLLDNVQIEKQKGNLKLWKSLLPKWSSENIIAVLNTENEEEAKELLTKGNTGTNTLKYINYARKCSKTFKIRAEYSWSYADIMEQEDLHTKSLKLAKEGLLLWENSKNKSLKQRYAYQVIRAYHYSKNYERAIHFYENHLLNTQVKDEMTYYLMDQVAGCYYSVENFNMAAQLFLEVFRESMDRKKSAFTSYKWCLQQGYHASISILNSTDYETTLVLKSIISQANSISALKELFEYNPKSHFVQLLYIRALNRIERTTCRKNDCNIFHKEGLYLKESNYLLEVANAKRREKEESEFWTLASSYCSFLSHNLPEAKATLKSIKSNKYQSQKDALSTIYLIHSWDRIGRKEERIIASLVKKEHLLDRYNDINKFSSKYYWQNSILSYCSQIYKEQNQSFKAYFLQYRDPDILKLPYDLNFIDSIQNYINKEAKSDFDQMLTSVIKSISVNSNSIDKNYLHHLKGLILMQQRDHRAALEEFKAIEINGITNYISPLVFSNNTMECFQCPEDEVMKDRVLEASVFRFLNQNLNHLILNQSLLKLDSLTKSSEKKWVRKLSHYLLGNYYFNVSNTGYFRGILWEQDNIHGMRIREYSGNEISYYYGLANDAKFHYQKTIDLSEDDELNARCHYMMAKCELNDLYNTTEESRYMEYEGSITGFEKHKENFKMLKNKYSDTQFYKDIIEECSFFSYYCSE